MFYRFLVLFFLFIFNDDRSGNSFKYIKTIYVITTKLGFFIQTLKAFQLLVELNHRQKLKIINKII